MIKQDKLKLLIINLILLDYYKEYVNIFLKDLINQLLENKLYNHTINLKLDKIALYKSLYNLNKTELITL